MTVDTMYYKNKVILFKMCAMFVQGVCQRVKLVTPRYVTGVVNLIR